MKQVGWRITLITTVPPVAAALDAALRELGHDPVAVVSARRGGGSRRVPKII